MCRERTVMNAEASSILIVDDEELNSEGLARLLRRHGYEVTVAPNGRKALELLGQRRFDLVLLDVLMPGMNGLEVLKLLRRVDSPLNLPVIMVTAKGESEDVVESLELGANDHVTKPIDFPVVLARIRTQLALGQAVARVTELERKLAARNRELEQTAAELAETNESVRRDLEAANRFRQAFLPDALAQVPGARLAWIFRPCGRPAGACLNVFRLGDLRLGLCVLDVKGPGVAAALLSVTASHLLARLSAVPGAAIASPVQVVRELSKQLSGEVAAERTFTLLYGILGLDTREFRFVSAGHPGPVCVPLDAPPVALEGNGLPIGVGQANYRDQVARLQPGDRLVLYCDGLTETRNAEGQHFGTVRLLEALARTCRRPLDESLNALLESVEGWHGNTPRQDLAILAAEMALPQSPA
jgi:sigma-B regulation protein RsbU (phosphoserine phosphatase)